MRLFSPVNLVELLLALALVHSAPATTCASVHRIPGCERLAVTVSAASNKKTSDHLIEKAQAAFDNWDLDLADRLLAKALARNPDSIDALALRGAIRCERGWAFGMPDELRLALIDLERVLSVSPGDARSLRYRGIAHRELDDNKQAVVDLTRSLDLKPDANTAGDLADTYAEMDQPKQAIAAYEQARQLDPTSPSYPLGRGQVHAQMGDYDTAIRDYTLALKLAPDYGIAYQYRSLAHYVIGNAASAMKDINHAITMSPSDVGSLYYRGMIELGAGNVKRADSDFRRAMEECETCVTYRVMTKITGRRLGKQDGLAIHFPAGQQLDWPAPLVSYFQRKTSFEAVLEAAKVPGRFNGADFQTCEAYFLAGEWRLAEGDTIGAKDYLAKAMNHCKRHWISWPTARDEITRLK